VRRTPKITLSELNAATEKAKLDWDKILSVVGAQAKPPENAFTVHQHAAKTGAGHKTTLTMLTKAAKDGKLGTGMYIDPNTSRVSRFFWVK
jgi:hypothetical protein